MKLNDLAFSNWNAIKKALYFEDGSLRDIYVLDTTLNDWMMWAEYVNKNYIVEFFDHNTNLSAAQLNMERVNMYWDGKLECVFSASVIIENAILKTYFFSPDEIEVDISPNEIINPEFHNALLIYMKDVSVLLGKSVLLCEENSKGNVLLRVDPVNIQQ
ncbi:hypothetical protein [Mucilaginibacter defluvii]|uniref:Immunity protein 22 of polymorphic toxin system n=1 Tax=Mucilaginibacter defluvii TaxID=1196019 RepID=A0ABP9G5P7_9SPHI